MPNSTTGLQPYKLMFECKAQTPCDSWVDVNNYDSNESVSKSSWVWEHHELIQLQINAHWRVYRKKAEQSALRIGGNELSNLEGNLV